MKSIHILVLFTTVLLLLTACQGTGTDSSSGDPNANHVGCQEGEIEVDGSCVPADNGTSNVDLFNQDLESFVVTEEVRADVTGGAPGFVAQPRESGTYPGVLMIHEWWGLNDNIKEMAQILAKEGYVVFAIDLYDGNVAEDSSRAGELASSVRSNPDEAVRKMQAALTYLRDVKGVSKTASLGWCFGGQQSLSVSLHDELDATVIYYGQLTDDREKLRNINWPVLGIFGEEDNGISVESVRSFESALDELGVENNIYVYPGVGHAFANPSGSNYAADETVDAWQKTVAFLNEELKGMQGTGAEQEISDQEMSLEESCVAAEGRWLAAYAECEFISAEQCAALGGSFNECDSACRHTPSDEPFQLCTMQCIPVCSFETEV